MVDYKLIGINLFRTLMGVEKRISVRMEVLVTNLSGPTGAYVQQTILVEPASIKRSTVVQVRRLNVTLIV